MEPGIEVARFPAGAWTFTCIPDRPAQHDETR